MAKKTTLTFGRSRPTRVSDDTTFHAARLALVCGAVTAVFFAGALTGAIPSEEKTQKDAIAVMSFADDPPPEETREMLRDPVHITAGEPFGFHNGRWNLWEYLGDVMAELLTGG